MSSSILLFTASFFGASGILLGAFGAHKLKTITDPDNLQSFKTGVSYQMFHAVALLFIGQLDLSNNRCLLYASIFFILGTFFFSFSIYGLVFAKIRKKKVSFLGPITPIGGLLLFVAWLLLGISSF